MVRRSNSRGAVGAAAQSPARRVGQTMGRPADRQTRCIWVEVTTLIAFAVIPGALYPGGVPVPLSRSDELRSDFGERRSRCAHRSTTQ